MCLSLYIYIKAQFYFCVTFQRKFHELLKATAALQECLHIFISDLQFPDIEKLYFSPCPVLSDSPYWLFLQLWTAICYPGPAADYTDFCFGHWTSGFSHHDAKYLEQFIDLSTIHLRTSLPCCVRLNRNTVLLQSIIYKMISAQVCTLQQFSGVLLLLSICHKDINRNVGTCFSDKGYR